MGAGYALWPAPFLMIIDLYNANDFELIKFGKDTTIGLTSGCYDLFHSLHLTYLQRCRRMCDVLIVGVDSDDFVKQTKGPDRPIIPEHQRVAIISALNCVDIAFVMGSLDDWAKAIHSFFPSKLFKCDDFKKEDVLNPLKSEVVIVPDQFQPDSTTCIIEEIKKARTQHER